MRPQPLFGTITLSPWVNEPLPPFSQLLTAHDIARLTRRPKWMLVGLSFVGRFPRKRRYRGRRMGWLRADVIEWLAKDLQADLRLRPLKIQQPLPLGEFRSLRRRRSRLPRGTGKRLVPSIRPIVAASTRSPENWS
jgi:hypothetical protein